jgi:hypothetical protein
MEHGDYFTEHGIIHYKGPGWYAYGICVGKDKSVKPIDKSFWVDLDHEHDVARMIDEGCPHGNGPEVHPEAVKPHQKSEPESFWDKTKRKFSETWDWIKRK